jgi:hypothetical protein
MFQYALVRGLLAYNLGENLDDLQCMVPTNDDFVRGANLSADYENVWTCIFMDIQLEDVILDVVPQRQGEESTASNEFMYRSNIRHTKYFNDSFSTTNYNVYFYYLQVRSWLELTFSSLALSLKASAMAPATSISSLKKFCLVIFDSPISQ